MIYERILTYLKQMCSRLMKHRSVVMSLAVVVVFVTTYMLILPAITLDQDTAEKTPGIDAQVEQVAEEEPAAEPAAAEEETVPEEETAPEEAEAVEEESAKSEAEEPKEEKSESEEAAEPEDGKAEAADEDATDAEKETIEGSGNSDVQKEATLLTYEGDDYQVEVDCPAEAGLPSDVQLRVTEIQKDTKDENGDKYEYQEYREKALEAVRDTDGADGKKRVRRVKLYDISFVSNGEEIEPAAPVKVRITYDKALKASDKNQVRAVHFDETKEKMDAEVLDAEAEIKSGKKLKEATFEAESFSVYAVVYTVDFSWNVDGETLEYSLPGGGCITLSELAKVLDIQKDDRELFVEDVKDISFSDPSLVWTGRVDEDTTVGEIKDVRELKVEYSAKLTELQIKEGNEQTVKAGDWVLISMRPFNTIETLTVSMETGEKFEVSVTDEQLTKTLITASGESYEITVKYGEDANIPDGAELKVAEILPEDKQYEEYYQKALKKAGVSDESGIQKCLGEDDSAASKGSYARIFDIEIWAENQKVEPSSDVSVEITLLDAPKDKDANLKVVHFGEKGPEVLSSENEDGTKAGEAELSFVTDEFSVYTVVDANSTALDGRSFALVSGISTDPGSTTGYQTDWGQDYFTIIVNAHAVMGYDGVLAIADRDEDWVEKTKGLGAEGVHAWTDTSGVNYVGGGATLWQFESAGSGRYRIFTEENGSRQYITHNNAEVSLTNNQSSATAFSVTANSDGTVLIHDGNMYLRNNAANANGNDKWAAWVNRNYILTGNNSAPTTEEYKFRLCQEAEGSGSFAAKKVAASTITTNTNYIIYRKFEDEAGNEELYALAHDGTFVRVYDGGDTVYWRETDKNLYWNYQMDGNYPVIFTQDPTTHEAIYLSPNYSTGQTMSSTAVGLTLIGKDRGAYSTAIECWDQAAYDYAGLHVTANSGTATLSAGTRTSVTSDEFLFAVASQMPGATAETVDTVDSDSLGIKITMFDYGEAKGNYAAGDHLQEMTDVAGSDEYSPHAAHKLVKPYLEDGIPSGSNGAMTDLFTADGSVVKAYQENVNHLFLQSYYDESGTFRYRSEDNYAYLPFDADTGTITGTDFTVYRQAATPYTSDQQPGHTYYYHGHFMPYNDIDMNNNLSRLMNQYGNDYQNGIATGELPIGDGRTYEDIYGVQGIPNFFTGMKMEAEFAQPRNGKLENGDDMIFKFTGDDDMWVYIDGVLVLDVGGIHEPLSGTINFATGAVTNPTGSSLAGPKTLYQIFQDVLNDSSTPQTVKDKISSITWKDVDGNGTPDTFADYTNHSFAAFYMERGAGASNLDIQFNLKVVLTNQFTVEKELPEDVDDRFVNQEFKFRATYKDATDQNTEKPLYAGAVNSQNETVCSSVVYRDKKDDQGNPVNVPVDENGYFYLRAGEAAIFKMEDDSVQYNVKEVDLDTYNLEKITINGDELAEHVEINDVQATITDNAAVAGYDEVADRSNVLYTNYPKTQNLRITKHLTEDSAPLVPGENPVFEFRVYLESTVAGDDGTMQHRLIPYSYGPYYLVKEVEGEPHYFTLTGANNAVVDKGTEPVVCSTTGRSGSINSIPPEYTIIIPNLAVGTNFYLEERRDNIPEGYEFVREELTDGTYESTNLDTSSDDAIHRVLARDETDHQEFDPETIGRITDTVDAESHVYNRKPAVVVTVEKAWDPEPDEGASVTVELHRYAKITKGTISVTLYDNNEAPIEGAEFELYKLNEDSGEYEATGTTVTTSVNGIAKVSELEKGSYKLVQKSTPKGYSMDGHTTETGVLTVQDNVTTPQTRNDVLTNTALVTAGRVTLTVTDSGAGSGTSGNPIEGATFTLYKDGAVYNTGYETNSEGQIVVGNLAAGEYYFVQNGTAANYNLPNVTRTESFTVQEQPGVTQEFTQSIMNSLKGKGTVSLTLTKDSGDAISGAAFELKQGSTVLASGTTGSDGTLTFGADLYEGSYTVHQVDTGSAGNDYRTADDQTVTIDANSQISQHKELTFENKEAGGNVTIKLWRKGGYDQWNWELANTYTGLKPGQTYTFVATINSGLYPGNVHFYSDDQDHVNSDSIDESKASALDASGMSDNNSTYTFDFTPQKNDTTYSLVLVSGWGVNDIHSMEMVTTRAAASKAASLQSSASRLLAKSMPKASLTSTAQSITHSDASPASAPAGYATDSTFVETYTLTADDDWKHTFDAQDKYDADGNPYYYYIVETECSDEDYWIDSYAGDENLNDTGTITVTNKKEKTGNLTVTKELLGEVTGNENKNYKVTIKNSAGKFLQSDKSSFGDTAYEFNVSVSSPLEITGIPIDTYTVTEKTEDGDVAIAGFLWVAGESTTEGTGTVAAGQTATVALKNYYTQEYTPVPSDTDQTTDLVVNKEWVKADGSTTPADDDTIKFRVRVKSANAYIPVAWNLYDAGAAAKNTDRSGIRYVQDGKTVTFTLNRFDEYVPSGGGAGKNNTSFAISCNVPLIRPGTTIEDTYHLPIPIPSSANTGGLSSQSKTLVREATVNQAIVFESQPIWPGSKWVESPPSAAHQWSFDLGVQDDAYFDSVQAMQGALIDDNATIEDLVYTLDNTGVHLDEAATTCNIRPASATAENWEAKLAGLPTYLKVSQGSEVSYKVYSYEVYEIEVNGKKVTNNRTDDYIVSTSTSGDTTSITNTEIKKVNVDAEKEWKNADDTTTPPVDGSVTFELYADGSPTGKTVVLDGKTREQEIIEDANLTEDEKTEAIAALAQAESGEFTAWKAEWRNLPKYSDDAQTQEIEYVVKEVTGYTGYTNQNADGVSSGGTITNEQDVLSFDILKEAQGAGTALPGATFVIQQVKSSSATTEPEYADGSSPSDPETTGADGKATFTGVIPGYYEVLETITPAGFVIDGDAAFYIKVDSSGIKLLKKVVGDHSVSFVEAGESEKVGNVTRSVSGTTVTFIVENKPGSALPHTGGPGTKLFTILGSMLVIGSGLLLLMRRRRTNS